MLVAVGELILRLHAEDAPGLVRVDDVIEGKATVPRHAIHDGGLDELEGRADILLWGERLVLARDAAAMHVVASKKTPNPALGERERSDAPVGLEARLLLEATGSAHDDLVRECDIGDDELCTRGRVDCSCDERVKNIAIELDVDGRAPLA